MFKKNALTNIIDWSPKFGSQNVFEEKNICLAIDFLSPTFFEEIMGKANIKIALENYFQFSQFISKFLNFIIRLR